VSGGIAELPRKAESLCSLVKSTWYELEFSGTLVDCPIDRVIEIPTTVTLNDRRLVFGGDVSGIARSVSANVMLPDFDGSVEALCINPQKSSQVVTPLHEAIKKATANSQKAKNFLNFIKFATTELGWHATSLMTGNRGLR
jgi:hypothetical protein